MHTIEDSIQFVKNEKNQRESQLSFLEKLAEIFPETDDVYEAQMKLIPERDELISENKALTIKLAEKSNALISNSSKVVSENIDLNSLNKKQAEKILTLENQLHIVTSACHYPAENETPVANVILGMLQDQIKKLNEVSKSKGTEFLQGSLFAFQETEQFCRLTFQARKGEIITLSTEKENGNDNS